MQYEETLLKYLEVQQYNIDQLKESVLFYAVCVCVCLCDSVLIKSDTLISTSLFKYFKLTCSLFKTIAN